MGISKKTNTRFGEVSEDDLFIFNEDAFIDTSEKDYEILISAKETMRSKIHYAKKRFAEEGIILDELFKVVWKKRQSTDETDYMYYSLVFEGMPGECVWFGRFLADRAIIRSIERINSKTDLPKREKAEQKRRW